MELSNAIKDIISRFGTKILPTRQFVNLLDDIGGFKDEPAASKKVMKGLLDSGFGELLYKLSEKKMVIGKIQYENVLETMLPNLDIRTNL